jgi:putative FmdB family regulatory protein
MPTYEYECTSCKHNFEAFQAMSDAPLKECPKCGKNIRRLIHGGTGVIFKGSGFYVTDKGKGPAKSSKPGSAPAEASGSHESKATTDGLGKADGAGKTGGDSSAGGTGKATEKKESASAGESKAKAAND